MAVLAGLLGVVWTFGLLAGAITSYAEPAATGEGMRLAERDDVGGDAAFAGAALSAESAESSLHSALLSWAVVLSGLPPPARAPRVARLPHAFFVRHACRGHECAVLGWFPAGDVVYLDQRLDPEHNLLAASIEVHEMEHYLQYQAAGGTVDFSCAHSVELERQAYGVQREFLTRYGVYHPVGASTHQVGCEDAP